MEQKTKRRLYAILPWLITLTVLGAFTLYGSIYKAGYNPFETQSIKIDLVSTMRIQLLEAIEAEKNAVLAITDEESEAFAVKARQATDSVEKNRKEIESIIQQGTHPKEIELVNEFNICWSQYRKLDETILNLAVQNTNLKAQKISSTQCAQEIQNFEESMNRMIQRDKKNNQCNEAVIPAYEAVTASFKIFALHKPHIEEADDKQMDNIEQSINSYDKSAKKALDTLSGIAALRDNTDLTSALTAYDRFMKLTSEVIRLSRMNTNIKSAELSLGKKRLISSQCQETLTTLQGTVQST
jgi:citrate lyase gamma subunit